MDSCSWVKLETLFEFLTASHNPSIFLSKGVIFSTISQPIIAIITGIIYLAKIRWCLSLIVADILKVIRADARALSQSGPILGRS
jgi:hypothetical protein